MSEVLLTDAKKQLHNLHSWPKRSAFLSSFKEIARVKINKPFVSGNQKLTLFSLKTLWHWKRAFLRRVKVLKNSFSIGPARLSKDYGKNKHRFESKSFLFRLKIKRNIFYLTNDLFANMREQFRLHEIGSIFFKSDLLKF